MYIFFCFDPCRNYVSSCFGASQRTKACPKSTIKTEKNVKFFQGNNNVNDVVLVSLLLTLTYFTFFPSISVVDFEQVNILWVSSTLADT